METEGVADVDVPEVEVEAVEESFETLDADFEVEGDDGGAAEEPESSPLDALDGWVVETDETAAFSAAGESEIRLDDLDTVDTTDPGTDADAGSGADEDTGDDAFAAFMGDEVVLSADELDVSVEEVELEPVPVEGEGAPELPPLEPAGDRPVPEMGTETVLEDLDEVETVFEPEAAGTVSADEPMGASYVEEAELEVESAPGPDMEAEAEAALEEAAAPAGFRFGKRDPHDKARRLARVLVSDMITYNPERHARALENDSLAEDFEEEIDKSWAEYVEQVGHELADSTSYWSDALNEILARGRPLF